MEALKKGKIKMNDYTKFSEEIKNNEIKEPDTFDTIEVKDDGHVVPDFLEETVLNAGGEVVKIEQEDQNEESLKATLYVQGVVKASKLNIRKEANKNADVLTVISKGTGVEINLTDSTEEFYCVKVLVNSELTDGYAMKEFIDLK